MSNRIDTKVLVTALIALSYLVRAAAYVIRQGWRNNNTHQKEEVMSLENVQLKAQADLGVARAQCDLAKNYRKGQGVGKNFKNAVSYYRKAAQQGIVEAQFALGQMYHLGQGVKRDHSKMFFYYQLAADEGNLAEAQYLLGFYYHKGFQHRRVQVIEQNSQLAILYYKKAVDQNYAPAIFHLKQIIDKIPL